MRKIQPLFYTILFFILLAIFPVHSKAEVLFTVPVVTEETKAVVGNAPNASKVELYKSTESGEILLDKIEYVLNGTYEFNHSFIVGEVYYIVLVEKTDSTGEEKREIKSFTVIDKAKSTLAKVTEKSNFIIGLVTEKEEVVVEFGKKKISLQADDSGVYKYQLKEQLKANEEVVLYRKQNGVYQQAKRIFVNDITPPILKNIPKINSLQTVIKGKTEPKATVLMYVNGKKYNTVKASAKGDFLLYSKLLKEKLKVTFYIEDASKNRSKAYNTVVTAKSQPSKVIINAPFIKQLPELARGCEVTSLAMMLQHAGQNVSKMTLAKKIKKVRYITKVSGGVVYHGNPYEGFVGNIYTFQQNGYGVYHGPIAELAKKYLKDRVIDITGESFSKIESYIATKKPVWVIINSQFTNLPSSSFTTWNTANGKVKITWREHAVLVTGYDQKYVYVNDPLTSKNRKLSKVNFKKAWEQMGKQAITYL